ncbi:hypothetical protein [Thiomonas sp.]
MKKVALLCGFVVTALLTGCGGGGSVASTTPVSSSASGTAAYGKPIAGGQILAIDSTGKQCGSATTNADGTYAINLDCVPGPVLFTVSSGAPNGIPLDSLAIPASGQGVSGTVNITPLTTLILYDALASLKLNLASNAQVIALGPQSFSASSFATTDQQATQTVLQALATTLSPLWHHAPVVQPRHAGFPSQWHGHRQVLRRLSRIRSIAQHRRPEHHRRVPSGGWLSLGAWRKPSFRRIGLRRFHRRRIRLRFGVRNWRAVRLPTAVL